MKSQQAASPPTGYNSFKTINRMERITENKKISFFFKRQTNTIADNTQAQNNIQSICQEEEQLNNWALILELADRLSRSEPESREAVKSLKKLIKLNNNQPIQIRAIRVSHENQKKNTKERTNILTLSIIYIYIHPHSSPSSYSLTHPIDLGVSHYHHLPLPL
jgi:hypothetical protein